MLRCVKLSLKKTCDLLDSNWVGQNEKISELKDQLKLQTSDTMNMILDWGEHERRSKREHDEMKLVKTERSLLKCKKAKQETNLNENDQRPSSSGHSTSTSNVL